MKTLNELEAAGYKAVVVRINETHHWDIDIATKAEKIEGVYLVDLTKPTHCCELAISYPYELLKNHFANTDGFSEDELAMYEQATSEDQGYFTSRNQFIIDKVYNDEREYEDILENEHCNPTIC